MRTIIVAILLMLAPVGAARAQIAEVPNTPRYTVPGYGDQLGTWANATMVGYVVQVAKRTPTGWLGIATSDGIQGTLALQAAINAAGSMSGFLRGRYVQVNASLAVIYPPQGPPGSGPPLSGDPGQDLLNAAIAATVTGAQVNDAPAFIVH